MKSNKFKSIIIDIIVMFMILSVSIFLVAFGKIGMLEIFILGLLIYVINLIFIFFIFIKEGNNQEKMSWIFFLVLIPIVGHIFFIIFRARRPKALPREEMNNFFNSTLNESNLIFKNELNPRQKKFQQMIKRNYYNTDISLITNGQEAFEKLFSDLRNAKKFIHIEMYIVKPSNVFEQLKYILIDKVKEGVEVKWITDDFGSWLIHEREFSFLKDNGIEIEIFNKVKFPLVKSSDNNRLHRKFFVIDGEVVHSGGINISDEYISFDSKYGYWADLNFTFKGNIVNDYETLFMYDWEKITKHHLDAKKYLKNNQSPPSSPNSALFFEEGPNVEENLLERMFVNWISNANNSIKITTPYFIPTKQIFDLLKNALKDGVKVQVFIPGRPDKKMVYLSSQFYLSELISLGAEVFLLENTFLHSKFAIFDEDFGYIGTNNLDMRSFFSNYESINIVEGQEVVANLNQICNEYKERSIVYKPKKYSKIQTTFLKFVLLIFSPLM